MRHVPKNQSVFQTVNSPMSIAWVFIALLVIELGCSSNPHSALHQHVATWESLAIQDKGEVVGQLTDAIEKTKSGNGFLIRVKVGSGKGTTFDRNQCAFLVSDIPDGEHAGDPGHDAEDCPFCRQKELLAPTVVVQVVGPDGKVLNFSAETSLGLKKGDHLLISGKGLYDDPLNCLTIEATGMERLQ